MNKTDIVFISYLESNADKNWLELKTRFPWAKRVHGVSGIRKAHKMAAARSEKEFFFVVDGDNRIHRNFAFDCGGLDLRSDTIYVWRCFNPANSLVYGYGAIKLYNKNLLEDSKSIYADFATAVAAKYEIVHEVASETRFFSTPEEAWRGAFRETAKLASRTIRGQKDCETAERLEAWCSTSNEVENGPWCLLGAKQGREFGERAREAGEGIEKINNYSWLQDQFKNQAQCNGGSP